MLLPVIAWRNLWRNKRRSMLTVGAVAFAEAVLIVMLGLQAGSYSNMILNFVRMQTGMLQVQHKDYKSDSKITQLIEDRDQVFEILEEIEEIEAYSPRVNAFALLASETETVGGMIIGVDPEREKEITILEELVRQGKYLSSEDRRGALIGKTLAKNLGVDVGDEIVLLGIAADGSTAADAMNVRGLFSIGISEMDRTMATAPIDFISEIFVIPENEIHEAAIMLENIGKTDEVKAEINGKLKEKRLDNVRALAWDDINPGLKQAIELDRSSGYLFYVVLLIIVGFGILNTILMAFFERIKEYGVLLSMGTSPARAWVMIMLEAFFIGALGMIVGAILGAGLSLYFQFHGLHFENMQEVMAYWGLEASLHSDFRLTHCLSAAIILMIITVVSSIVPALRIYRIKPAEALRTP